MVGPALRVGVLALQGAFREHCAGLAACGAEPVEVRRPEALDGLRGLIIPGGESTTIGKLMLEWGLLEPLRAAGRRGLPIWGTCAGLILLCRHIRTDAGESDQPRLGLLDATARRNAFGRQRESFEADIPLPECGPELGASPFRAVFIRAPLIERVGSGVTVLGRVRAPRGAGPDANPDANPDVGSAAGPNAQPGARAEAQPDAEAAAGRERVVMVRQGALLATSFHPELTPDPRLHRYFLGMCGAGSPPSAAGAFRHV